MKILVTGNGFDISYGLPTRYLDFINTLNLLRQNPIGNLNGLYDTYFWNKLFKHQLGVETYNIVLIEELQKKLNNVWYNFFSDQLEIDTWIDFESKLENALIRLDEQVNYIKSNLFVADNDIYLTFPIDKHIGFNSNKFQLLETFDLISKHHEFGDSFILSSKYCKLNSKANAYCEFNEDAFYNFLIDQWESFIQLFNDYIEIFVNPLINTIEMQNVILVDRHFTFNYTNTYEKVLHSGVKTNHLHGRISESKNLVLGFDHFGYEKLSKNIIPFTKGFQRLNKDSDYKFLKYLETNSHDLTVLFLGHSLDISDKKYIDEVIDLISDKIKGRKGTLKIFYHSSKNELIKNLCNIYGIDTIEDLMSRQKIEFFKSDVGVMERELKFVDNKKRFTSQILSNL